MGKKTSAEEVKDISHVKSESGGSPKETRQYPKRYLITSAQASYWPSKGKDGNLEMIVRGPVATPNENLLESFENYCKEIGADLIILAMQGKDTYETAFHEGISRREELFYGNLKLNSNCAISDMKIPPQNVDPTTGRERFAQRDTTLIYAHPKQRFKAVPTSNIKLPKSLVTTGAVTYPNYHARREGNKWVGKNHRADVAFRDHTYGAAIVEVFDDNHYNIRLARAFESGAFVDMGMRFDGKNTSKVNAEALVLGDVHLGDHEKSSLEASYEMIDYFNPRRIILHDFFNGHSINHHEKDKLVTRVQDYEGERLFLEQELKMNYEELLKMSKMIGSKNEIYVVASNHHFFIDRYLERSEFMREPWNAKMALRLAEKMSEGKNPLEEGIKMMGKLPSNVNFLNLDDDLKAWGYQLSSHGHLGISGGKGSVRSRELAYGKSISGHTHTPEIFRDTYVVGTNSKLNLPYTKGSANSWLAANAVLYEGGLVQLLPIIGGKWKGSF